MRKNILVIGGAGYIGSHMVYSLLEKRYIPVVFDNLSTGQRKFVPKGVDFIKGDLRKERDIRKVFEEYSIDAVMHFAAFSLVGESVKKPLKYYENNVCAFVNLIKVMTEFAVKRIIFSSTAAVYGEPEHIPIKENNAIEPSNPYGCSKRMIERILEDTAQAGGVSYIILRYFNVAGANPSARIGEIHHPETHLIPSVLKVSNRERKELVIFGDDYPTKDGTCLRDYIHVQDLCQAHLLALEALKGKMRNEVFNLGNGSGYTVKEVIDKVEEVTGKKIKVKIGPRRHGDPAKLVASSEKAKKILGWRPRYSLKEIISTAWEWERSKK